jgi:hypothetical protein
MFGKVYLENASHSGKAPQSQIVSISTDADSGKQALLIDTTVFNGSGTIMEVER